MKKNYILGLDVGISSVGWGLIELNEKNEPYKVLDVGSRIFAPGEVEKTGDSRAKERRENRGTRRVIRRREFRLDRVRNLLYQNGYLKGSIKTNIVSEKNIILTDIYNQMINNYYKNNSTNPYKLKVKALDEKLKEEELCIILVHYAKKRGYKSNRESSSENDNGKVLNAIKENKELMSNKKYRTISEMYIKDEKFKTKIKNSAGDYKISVENSMYLEEINKVLDAQIKFKSIKKEFKEEYLEIYNSRRHYSDGPGYYIETLSNGKKIKKRSPYGGNLIERMTGKCVFDKKPRAPKKAPSSELFVAISKLVNLRYKTSDDNSYISLTKEEIEEIIKIAKEKQNVTYQDIAKIINKENIIFQNLNLSKKDYISVITETKEKLKIDNKEKLIINKLSLEDIKIYNKIYYKKLYNSILIKLEGYHKLKTIIVKCFGKEEWEKQKDNINMLDELALYCTNYKLNEEIEKHIKESDLFDKKYQDKEFIKALPNLKDHVNLSTDIIRKLIPVMIKGNTYDKAMSEIGISHSDLTKNIEKVDLLVPILTNSDIRNQRVIRSLTQTRKVVNAIIKKYGLPKEINVETARELAKSRKERNEIEKSQAENKDKNDRIKKHLLELEIFKDESKISGLDILKYKLWQEQEECSGYSKKKITLEELYGNNIVQIDHILPYSRTYNDNYLNKTLVFSKENQEKGDRTPYEWMGHTKEWENYETFIDNLNISQKKKDNYLLKNLDFEMQREMQNQNLNDTKYISKELASILKTYLNIEKVNVYQGSVTAKLRARWGLNRLTHSYISKTCIMPDDMKIDIKKDRDNHLHHAMDALVIASITPSLQQKITRYEKYKRYIIGKTKKELSELRKENIKLGEVSIIDETTGEVIEETGIKDYIDNQVTKGNIIFMKHDIAKIKFPLPYEAFAKEAKFRVYEMNKQELQNDLLEFNTYSKKELKNIAPLTPSISKTKESGVIHKDTYFGIVDIKDENEETNTYRTIRKPLEKINKKDLLNIPDKKGSNKDIYDAIIKWFGTSETGEEALKKHDGKYPVSLSDKEKKEIKRFKIYLPYKNTGHNVNGTSVDKGGVYRIGIYKSKDENDEKMYFIPYDLFDIAKLFKSKKQNKSDIEDYTVKLEYGRGAKYTLLKYKELLENYEQIDLLFKNDLVTIENKSGQIATGYIVGESSGLLEIKSAIGDGYDLIGEEKIFNKPQSQYQITISTIKSIKKLSISILGEISEL